MKMDFVVPKKKDTPYEFHLEDVCIRDIEYEDKTLRIDIVDDSNRDDKKYI